MAEHVFTAVNNHTDACGTPQRVDSADHSYTGYFENPYGEQWIFAFDRETRTATLWGGDIGWENPVAFRSIDEVGLVLNKPERLWLSACLAACGM